MGFWRFDLKKVKGYKAIDVRKILDDYRDQSPKSRFKHVGVELEVVSPVEDYEIAKELARAGLVDYVQLTTDGSIETNGDYDNNENGYELRVIARQKVINSIIVRVCKVLKDLGCKVNDSCGLHVHLDMRSRTPSTCFKRLVNKLPELKTLVTKDRIDGEYCRENYCNDLKILNKYKDQDGDIYDDDDMSNEDYRTRVKELQSYREHDLDR